MRKLILSIACTAALALSVFAAGCNEGKAQATGEVDLNSLSLDEIIEKAKEEGEVNSVGMPDTWANWVETWQDLESEYGLKHTDNDMSSAEEIAIFEQEKNKPTKDIGDVGQSFGPIAKKKGVTKAYKTSYWNEIPDWAKDDEGHWIVAYYGTISFAINNNLVDNPPQSFKDLLDGDYKVTIGDVNSATQAQNAVLSAAFANGGDEKNIQPGIDFFAKLAEEGRLDLGGSSVQRLEKGEIQVGLFWDFNALNYVAQAEKSNPDADFTVLIPSDGAVSSGYSTIINAYAPNPHAAALAREYILSDEGQINLARGYAKPIRDNVKLPADVAEMLLPQEQYAVARPIEDADAWEETTKNLGDLWQSEVLVKVK